MFVFDHIRACLIGWIEVPRTIVLLASPGTENIT